jgi:hypothetical protein
LKLDRERSRQTFEVGSRMFDVNLRVSNFRYLSSNLRAWVALDTPSTPLAFIRAILQMNKPL